MVEKRNILKIYILGLVTLGLYFLWWFKKAKDDINELGADIPTAWLLIIPIANIYWLWKFAKGFSRYVKKDENTVLWFLLFWFVGILAPAIVQSELNKIAEGESS